MSKVVKKYYETAVVQLYSIFYFGLRKVDSKLCLLRLRFVMAVKVCGYQRLGGTCSPHYLV